jgi:competence protein ComEA
MLRVCLSVFALAACLAGEVLAQAPVPRPEPTAVKPAVLINLNTATAAQLDSLPGIGPKVAARIIDYRTKKGPFRKVEELMNVQGVGEKSFLKLRAQLTVSPAAASTASQQ